MNLNQLQSKIQQAILLPLPGIDAQVMLGRVGAVDLKRFHQIPDHAIQSAVMIILYEKQNTIFIPFIVRANDGRVHSGQIAFPGGRFDTGDQNLQHTALREVAEEIGVNPLKLNVIGKLTPLYIPPSNYLVHPFIAVAKQLPIFKRDDIEVAEILELKLNDFLDQNVIIESTFKVTTGEDVKASCFNIQGNLIWGATAMIMNELLEIIKK